MSCEETYHGLKCQAPEAHGPDGHWAGGTRGGDGWDGQWDIEWMADGYQNSRGGYPQVIRTIADSWIYVTDPDEWTAEERAVILSTGLKRATVHMARVLGTLADDVARAQQALADMLDLYNQRGQ